MYDRILLATDGEVGVERAAEHALELGAFADATVRVLYVVDESIYGAYSGDEFVQEHEGPQATLEERGEDALNAIAEAGADSGVAVEREMRYGTPAPEIVAEAEEYDADLLVVGTRTQPEEYRQLLGSVTERVLRLTDRPVTVVKTAASAD
jgi:nucleotide-binding universal stress UspA family protein